MLWDTYKMIDALNVKGVEAAYLLVGASGKDWQASYRHCTQGSKTTELFERGAREHRSDELFRANAHAWYEVLWGGSARPLRVPTRIRTVRVENAAMYIDGANCAACGSKPAARIGWSSHPTGTAVIGRWASSHASTT